MSLIKDVRPINIQIQRGPFDRKKRQLVITPDRVQFEDKNGSKPLTIMLKDEIREYRYGIKWIKGFEFTVGREYLLYIHSSSNEILKISFKTFYGIKKNECHKLSNDILSAVWYFFFGHIANACYHKFKNGEPVTISKAMLIGEGIIIDEGGVFKSVKKIIPWEELEIKEYHTYLAIFSTINPKLYATFSYLNDWNTGVLYAVVKTIINSLKQ